MKPKNVHIWDAPPQIKKKKKPAVEVLPPDTRQRGLKIIRHQPKDVKGKGRKGRPNTKTSIASERKRRAIIREAENNGKELPLDYMLRIMRDPSVEEVRRDDMARAAAPYVHAKLQSMQLIGDPKKPLYNRIERVIVRPQDATGRTITLTDSDS